MIRAGDVATIAAAGALVGVAVWRLARSRPAVRPVDAPILVASVLVLAAAVAVASGQLRDLAALDPSARDAQAVALLALGLAFGWRGVLRVHRRAALVGIVARVAAAPAPGRLREALAALIGDPQLRLAFPLDGWGTMIDTDGRPAPPTPARAQVTRLARDGRPLVALVHRRGLVEEPSLAREVAATAGLVVEHERVRAEERARLRELHASRVRLVSAGDAERRRLERDLHDGAQQRLVGLAMTLGSAPDAAAPTEARPQLAIARARLEDAVAELRTLARGIFPPALAVEGLAAALEDLAYAAPVRVRVAPWSIGRTDPVVEATAYLVATLAVRHAPPTGIALRVETEANALRLVAEPSWPPAVELDELAERVAALDGRLLADAGRVHVELPCAW
jgi:signal transduction histidine kinase